jgi:hypothetical protein
LGTKSRHRAGTVSEDKKQQPQQRVNEADIKSKKSEQQQPEQPEQDDIAAPTAITQEVHAGQKRKTPPSSSFTLPEDTAAENNEVDADAPSVPAKKRSRPAMGGKELRALAQAAHFAMGGLGRSAHAFAGISADMFNAASSSSSGPSSSSSSSLPSSLSSPKPSSNAGNETAKTEVEVTPPAQATRVSARQRERRDRAAATAVDASAVTPSSAKKAGSSNNNRAQTATNKPASSVIAASPLSECTPLPLSTSVLGEQRSPSLSSAPGVPEVDKEEEEAMNIVPPLLPTPVSLPRELPSTKRRNTGNSKHTTTTTITNGNDNSNKSNGRTRRPSHHERSSSNASSTTYSSAASVSGESTHTLVADSSALHHGRSRSHSLSGQSDVSEATTAVGEQQKQQKRGGKGDSIPLDSVLFKSVGSDLEDDDSLMMEGEEAGDLDEDIDQPGRQRRVVHNTRASRSRSRSSKRTAKPTSKKALLIDEAAAAVNAAAKRKAARARR